MLNHFWATIKHLNVIVFNQNCKNLTKNSFFTKSNFSRKNFARTVWEWGGVNGKLAVIGREVWNSLSYWSIKKAGQNYMPQKQAAISDLKTALISNSSYHHFHNFTVLFQPRSVEIYIKHRKI
jgi:hypothetical protein